MPQALATIGILVSLLLPGCASKNQGWVRAKKENSADAYRRFVRAEPADKHASEALQRLERLDWDHAEKQNTSAAWGAYLTYHKDSTRRVEAEQNVAEARWQEAKADGSKARYQIFLSNHPDNPHVAEANAHLDDLEFEVAQQQDTAASYGLYLDRHFSGAHAKEARQLYEDRNWQTAIDADSIDGYTSFLGRFPEGRYRGHCEELLAGFRFKGLGIRIVVRSLYRTESPQHWVSLVKKRLEATLKKEKLPYEWLPVVDARNQPNLDPLQGLSEAVPEGYGAMVIEIEEKAGRPFEPRGYATDVQAKVHLVPIRMIPMRTQTIQATTRRTVRAESLMGLHTDAQQDFVDKLSVAPIGWSKWLDAEEAEPKKQ